MLRPYITLYCMGLLGKYRASQRLTRLKYYQMLLMIGKLTRRHKHTLLDAQMILLFSKSPVQG
jgi:hypothetical protein